MDLFGARKGGEPQAAPRELLNLMVCVIPKVLTMEDPFDLKSPGATPKSVPTIQADLLLIGSHPGQTFEYGATEGKDGTPAQPARRRVTLPALLSDQVFSQQQLVKAWTPFVAKGGVVGQVTQNGGRAFLFESPDPSHPAWQAAAELIAKIELKTFPPTVPQEINAATPTATPVAAAQPAYVPATAAAPVYVQPVVTAYAGAAPQRPANIPEAAWAQMAPAIQAQVAAANPAPAGPNLDVPIAGMEQAWPYMDAAARANAYASAAAAVGQI